MILQDIWTYSFLLFWIRISSHTHFTYGSVVDEIDDNHVRQIPFPLLKNKAIQDRINALVLEASKKRYEAYLLEQQAIEIMNNEVIFVK